MSINLIGEIFTEIDNFELSEPVKSTIIAQSLTNSLLRKDIEESCLFLQEQEFCNEKSKQAEFYKWYDVYSTNHSINETLLLLENTNELFSKLNITKPTKQGLVYDVRLGGDCNNNSEDLDKLVKDVISRFQEEQDCKLNDWLSFFIQNIGQEDAKNILDKIYDILKKYGNKSSIFYENILSQHINTFSLLVIRAMANEKEYFYSEDTILKLEQHLLEIYKNNLQESVNTSSLESYFNIILKNILDNRSSEPSHILFLSQLVSNIDYYSKFANKVADRLYQDLKNDDINISLYPKSIFKNFMILLEELEEVPTSDITINSDEKYKDHQPIIALLREAYIKNIYSNEKNEQSEMQGSK